MLCRNKRHYYRFKLHNVDNEVGLITGEDWIKYIEDCGVKQGWTIQFIVSKDYVLISQFDPDGNCNDGRRIYEYGITLMSGLSVSTKHSSSGQLHKNTCINDAKVGDLKKSVSYSSGSSKLFNNEKVTVVVIRQD
ncbi:hypothetical protein Tco_0514927 [Tanacetum coccineum]